MLVWLLVFLLLIAFIYVAYKIVFLPPKEKRKDTKDQHYTFKI